MEPELRLARARRRSLGGRAELVRWELAAGQTKPVALAGRASEREGCPIPSPTRPNNADNWPLAANLEPKSIIARPPTLNARRASIYHRPPAGSGRHFWGLGARRVRRGQASAAVCARIERLAEFAAAACKTMARLGWLDSSYLHPARRDRVTAAGADRSSGRRGKLEAGNRPPARTPTKH